MSAEVGQIGMLKEAWGPRFWLILHTLAELSGNQTTTILSNDEADAWILLLKSQTFVMPCQACKEHYLEWQKGNRYTHLRNIVGNERKLWIRKWLWGCHNRVNEMTGKSSPELEELSNLYPKKNIGIEFQELNTMFTMAVTMQKLKSEDVIRWKRILLRLRIMYGV